MKTIQSAVAQRLLPLRCVICRARINRLTSSSGTWRLQESASSYSVGCKSWSVSERQRGDILWLILIIHVFKIRFLDRQALTVSEHIHIPWEKKWHSLQVFIQWARDRLVHQVGNFFFLLEMRDHELFFNFLVFFTLEYSSGSANSRTSNVSSSSSNAVDNKHHHNHNCSTNGCLGAIPRNPSYSSTHHFRGHKSHSFRVSRDDCD